MSQKTELLNSRQPTQEAIAATIELFKKTPFIDGLGENRGTVSKIDIYLLAAS